MRSLYDHHQSASSSSGQQPPDSRSRGVPPQREEPTILQREEPTILRNGCVGTQGPGRQQQEQLELCARCGEGREVLFMCHRCTRFYCRDVEPPCIDMCGVFLEIPQTPPAPPRWVEHLRAVCIYCNPLVVDTFLRPTTPEVGGEVSTLLGTESDSEPEPEDINGPHPEVINGPHSEV